MSSKGSNVDTWATLSYFLVPPGFRVFLLDDLSHICSSVSCLHPLSLYISVWSQSSISPGLYFYKLELKFLPRSLYCLKALSCVWYCDWLQAWQPTQELYCINNTLSFFLPSQLHMVELTQIYCQILTLFCTGISVEFGRPSKVWSAQFHAYNP